MNLLGAPAMEIADHRDGGHAGGRRSVPCSADHRRPQRAPHQGPKGPRDDPSGRDPNTIIFTDESLFDCSDTKLRQWVVKGEKPKMTRIPLHYGQERLGVEQASRPAVGVLPLLFCASEDAMPVDFRPLIEGGAA